MTVFSRIAASGGQVPVPRLRPGAAGVTETLPLRSVARKRRPPRGTACRKRGRKGAGPAGLLRTVTRVFA